ncbi:MAG: lectin-like protein, partial [Deferrisomatales bacterium]|nr:lectin-like protein [Deferrisomatales bacterium]
MRQGTCLALVCAILLTGAIGARADIDAGLVAYYPLNGTAHEWTGAVPDVNGTLDGGVNWATSLHGKAARFDGVDDYIDIPFDPVLEPSVFSISLWFKTSVNGRAGTLLTPDHTADCSHGYKLRIEPAGTVLFDMDPSSDCGSAPIVVRSTQPMNDGHWHHLVAVYDGALRLYADGVLQGTPVSSTYAKSHASIRVGMQRRSVTDKLYLDGAIDEIRIYNRAVTAADVLELQQAPGVEMPPPVVSFPGDGHWYQRVDGPDRWLGAKRYCEAFGGHLATPTSLAENDFVYGSLCDNGVNYWLGGTDQVSEGTWKWITGEPWSFTRWAPGEPDNLSNQDYLAFYSKSPARWDDQGTPSKGLAPFLCEWDHLDDLAEVLEKCDLDADGDVDGSDQALFDGAYGTLPGDPGYLERADVDGDGNRDTWDLIPFASMLGQVEAPTYLPEAPALDQGDYEFLDASGTLGPGGCVPVSFAMLFIHYFNRYNPYGLDIDTAPLSPNTVNIVQSVATHLDAYIPAGGGTWVDDVAVLTRMRDYTVTFDTEQSPACVSVDWEIDYWPVADKTSDGWVEFIRGKLTVGEPVLFHGYAHIPAGEGGHASLVTGYLRLEGAEYLRIHDTWDRQASWWRLRRSQSLTVETTVQEDVLRLDR